MWVFKWVLSMCESVSMSKVSPKQCSVLVVWFFMVIILSFTIHHSGYHFYLYILTSFNILMTLVSSFLYLCGVLYHPYLLMFAQAPPLLLPCGPACLSPTFLWNVECTCKQIQFQVKLQRFSWSRITHATEEAVLCKTIESTCGTLEVGQFNWRRRWWWWTKVWFGQLP